VFAKGPQPQKCNPLLPSLRNDFLYSVVTHVMFFRRDVLLVIQSVVRSLQQSVGGGFRKIPTCSKRVATIFPLYAKTCIARLPRRLTYGLLSCTFSRGPFRTHSTVKIRVWCSVCALQRTTQY